MHDTFAFRLTFHPHALNVGGYQLHCNTLVVLAKARGMNAVVSQVFFALWEDEQADGKKIPRWQPARVVKSTVVSHPSDGMLCGWRKKTAFWWKSQLPMIRIKLSILLV